MKCKLSQQRFWPCHNSRLNGVIFNGASHSAHEFQASNPLLNIRTNLDKPQYRDANLKLKNRLWGIVAQFCRAHSQGRQAQNLCKLSLTFIIDWRVVQTNVLSEFYEIIWMKGLTNLQSCKDGKNIRQIYDCGFLQNHQTGFITQYLSIRLFRMNNTFSKFSKYVQLYTRVF